MGESSQSVQDGLMETLSATAIKPAAKNGCSDGTGD